MTHQFEDLKTSLNKEKLYIFAQLKIFLWGLLTHGSFTTLSSTCVQETLA